MPKWSPTPEWQGQDAYLIGGGPSLSGFDFQRLRDKKVIGCNDAFRLGPEIVDICLFCDASFFHSHKWELEKWPGRMVTNAPTLLELNCPWLLQMKRQKDGLTEGETLGFNLSTGASAINLALALGSRRIFLLGYDLSRSNAGDSHWHRHNPKMTKDASFERFQKGFDHVSRCLIQYPTAQVLNVTNGESRLQGFDRISFEELWRLTS